MKDAEKFILEDLPKSAVVNSNIHAARDYDELEEIINSAVSEHLNKIIDDHAQENFDFENDLEKNNKKIVDELSENSNITANKLDNSFGDIELIKQEAYNQGLEDAKNKYEPLLAELARDKDFSLLLQEKLEAIIPESNIDSQIARVSAEVIITIAKKLHLILPSDFEKTIRKGLIGKLEQFYKDGMITLIVNPNRYGFCREILKSDSIPVKFKDNFHVIQDNKLGIDDCKLEWENTCLEYTKEQLTSEIDLIIEQLKSAT